MQPDPSPEEIARATSGDVVAFTRIVERYQGMAYSIAYNILGDCRDAEDAAQEALLRCYRRLGQFRGDASFTTWFFRVVVSSALDLRRREQRRPETVPLDELVDELGAGSPEGLDGPVLVGALGELPDDYRVPTVLRDVYGLPYQDIAVFIGRPLGTVKVMVHRGRARLRLRLRARGLGPQSDDETDGG
ncbi:MAG TPA: RNA polymerase sigma factor [Thermoleophilia bacterium]|nr:RNA polymerase sigma factor [Thermoleophilia bacterium]